MIARRPDERDRGRFGDPTPLKHSLERVIGALGGPGVDAIVTIHSRWDEIVGVEVAELSRPVSIDDGVLRVRVSGAAWASHLRWAEPEIIDRLRDMVGAGVVTSMAISVGRT